MLTHDPGSLVFGAWDSTALGKDRGPRQKWPRALTCAIAATRVERVRLAGHPIDPLGIEGTGYHWVEQADGTLAADPQGPRGGETVRVLVANDSGGETRESPEHVFDRRVPRTMGGL